ncbi:putative disease resistance RPP13-like protein 1 [Humulus lupulus]|uniref:putative disease resistance RPP13-like protein 1 n=1 Tax=Humulus lupulus TaxID=3486 RepID=UPI002B40E4D6|nr:putative disease resistance RPP13-like protein 1 [Humulus lupulus]XP_062117676.1 putative disease resistance RPP13-like protein 1 [Humulus lupulus]XP_062117677.1 putative disease resistance RPP13-like protein 1 [Humulus lupulus]XP_062117678.1 putative disease resistance RPP13-like protein 1 [Humulus lupulus]XP_062117679.1 putative disease resistance RPP13-like protein 1 [Humulus lupulus]XP_062117680.1 putative disease resistance RPP13-like protein 1 [Humulus lupulus]XP_062117681.1 putative
MAAELVVGPVISASVEFLLKKIVSSEVATFLRGKKDSCFDRLLDKLKTTFLSLAEVLGDAEQKQMRNPRVEEWLDKLQDALEDAEDLFDEIEYDALKRKVGAEYKSKVRKFFSSFNSTDKDREKDMGELVERLETFEKQRYILNLQKGVERIQSKRPLSISSIDDYEFYGRDDEKKILKETLMSDEVGSEKICVIPIVGLGGIGKTTLAQAAYNDDEVNKHFELKAWVCVSDEFDVCKVTKIVHEAITRDACDVESLNVMQEKIQQRLKEKKFLVILDDVWCEQYDFWDKMRMVFKVGAQGSKIIVTTRSRKVASIMGTTKVRHLNELNEEACLKLFVKVVSRNEEFTTESDLERIGKEIVKKCKGLPLAVKALASLLCFTDVKQWERIAKSDIFDLPVGGENILPALTLSYYYLPLYLKRCFVYCSMFPKDYAFTKDELVSLWMVDNLLEHSSGNMTRKEVGYEYFNDLVSRSFFQPLSSTYKSEHFVMHDLMVDLANFVSRKKFIHIERNKSCEIGLIKHTRHIAIDGKNDFHELFKSISETISLRTFLPLVSSLYEMNKIEQYVLEDLSKLKRLRFLSLKGYIHVNELPNSIGELRHLRYLDVSYTSIKELPKSFCLLYNLQTIKILGCKDLTKLPKTFHHLVNLRYLDIDCPKLSTFPPLGQLPALETLWIENCDAIETVGLEFYGTTSTPFVSLETLEFRGMSNWKEWSMPKPNAEAFPKLKSLVISVCPSLGGDLPYLLPSLTELRIFKCPELGSSLPMMPNVNEVSIHQCAKLAGFKSCNGVQNFDQRCVPANLRNLFISHCDNIEFLPPYEYESLQQLSIENFSSSFELLHIGSFPNIRKVEIQNCEYVESFSQFNSPINSISTLSIHRCPNFTLLPDSNLHCPILTQMELSDCSKLRFLPEKLPTLLPSLQELVIYDCPELESLPRFGLPLSLRELTIKDCDKVIASRKNWNLRALPNLISFDFGWYKGEDMVSFLEQGLLPTSLTSLKIDGVACLKTLDDKGFQELTSLKELHIYGCPNLQSLPVKGVPPSFESSLPPSFESFILCGCSLLEANYEWKEEEYYKKISCIPQSQVPISSQPQPQVPISPQKQSFSWFGPKALLFQIALTLLCIYLYMYFNL